MRFMTNPTPRLPPLFLVQGQSPRTASRIWLVFNGLVGKTAGVAPVSAADFAALARSSPWRWTALRFTARWPGDSWRAQELRAWLRRPDRLRVETVDGALVQVVHESPRQLSVLTSDGNRYSATLPRWTAPHAPPPPLRADGLVAARPDRFEYDFAFDAPMYRDYFWVAMLDPVELADGRSPDGDATLSGTEIDAITVVDHAGRPAWEANLRPTPCSSPHRQNRPALGGRLRWNDCHPNRPPTQRDGAATFGRLTGPGDRSR